MKNPKLKIKKLIKKILPKKIPQKIGLALGGGAARGIAHIGVLKVLEENNIPVHIIAGTSSGALFGALYAGGVSVPEMVHESTRTGWSRLVRLILSRRGAVSAEAMEKLVYQSIGHREFSRLNKPFYIVATDIRTGEQVILKEGDLALAIHASSAVPGVFAPVRINGRLLVDGMVVNNVPANLLKALGADFVIAVDVIPRCIMEKDPDNFVETAERAIDIGMKIQSRLTLQNADVIIEPVTENIGPFELSKSKILIEMGERAALEVIESIKKQT